MWYREPILLFVKASCRQPSTYLWEDDVGEVHTFHKARAESFLPWPAPCSLRSVSPETEGDHSRISVHAGKTKVSNRHCVARRFLHSPHTNRVQGSRHNSGASRFRADCFLEGKISDSCWRESLKFQTRGRRGCCCLSAQQAQAEFFLREMVCGSPRPGRLAVFLMQIFPTCGAQELSSLFLWEGGIRLWSARRTQPAAHWASWAAHSKCEGTPPGCGGHHSGGDPKVTMWPQLLEHERAMLRSHRGALASTPPV